MSSALRLLLLFVTCLVAAVAADLNGANLGTPILGPKVTAADLTGKVVVFEYWGIHCPPCLANIGHVSTLATLADRDRLVVIANHCQESGQTAAVWRSHGGTEAVSVIEQGELTNADVSGIPRVFVFDHRGTQVYDGHPGQLDEAQLKKWLDAVPGPLLPKGDFPACAREAQILGNRDAPAGSALKSLRAKVAAGKDPAASEAKIILAAATTAVESRLESIKTDRAANPLQAQRTLTRFITLLHGDELAAPFEALAKELKSDKVFQAEAKAADILDQIRQTGNKLGAGEFQLTNSKRVQINELTQQLIYLSRKYPDTRASKEALVVAESWTNALTKR